VQQFFQAESKFTQIQQSPAKPGKEKQRKKALISLDSLGGIEPFQWVAPTPKGKIFFVRSSPAVGLRASDDFDRHAGASYHDF
jgi:hypothetical protein